jgi:Tol biopolymer transport system component
VKVGSELRILDSSDGSVRRLCQRGACGQDLTQLAWSPDSANLTFTDAPVAILGPDLPASSIWNVGVTGGRARLSAGSACLHVSGAEPCYADTSPTWSPDGLTIAFLRTSSSAIPTRTVETSLVRINLNGLIIGQTRLCEGALECSASRLFWSPDGNSILFGSESVPGTKPEVVDPVTGQITTVPVETGAACATPQQPSWSPDGKLIAFIGGPRGSENLCTVARDGGLARVLVPALPGFQLSAGRGFTWLPAGAIDLSRARPARSQASPQAEPAPPGTIVFASSSGQSLQTGDEEIWSLRSEGTGLRRLTSNGSADSSPKVSPDGSTIAFVRQGDVWAMNVDGSRAHPLTRVGQNVTDPAWSPDGTRIAFEISSGSRKQMDTGIYVMRSDGSHLRLALQGLIFGLAWGDAGTITYSAGDATNNQLKLFNLDLATGATRPFLSLPGEETSPAWSPDGSTLAFGWNSTAGDGLYLVDADGSNLREVVGTPFTSGGSLRSIAWAPDGSWLAFEGVGPRDHIQIYEVRADGSGLRRLTGFPGTAPDNGVYAVTGNPSWGP